VPLYLVLDDSAVWEMRELRKGPNVNPWSFPGIVAMCNLGIIGRSEDCDFSLLLPDVISREIDATLRQQPLLKKPYNDCREAFISQLIQADLMNYVDTGAGDSGSMWLSPDDIREALALRIEMNVIHSIEFALVWMNNSLAVARDSSDKLIDTTPNGRLVTVFVTANPSVVEWITYLNNRPSRPTDSEDMRSKLEYISPVELSTLLRIRFPELATTLTLPGSFTPKDVPRPAIPPSLKVTASTISEIIRQARSSPISSVYLNSRTTGTYISPVPAARQKVMPEVQDSGLGLPPIQSLCGQLMGSTPKPPMFVEELERKLAEDQFMMQAAVNSLPGLTRVSEAGFRGMPVNQSSISDGQRVMQNSQNWDGSRLYISQPDDKIKKHFFELVVLIGQYRDWFHAHTNIIVDPPCRDTACRLVNKCALCINRWIDLFSLASQDGLKAELFSAYMLLDELSRSIQDLLSTENFSEISFGRDLLARSMSLTSASL